MKLLLADKIIICTLVFLLLAHATTNLFVWKLGEVAEKIGVAEEIALEYEANPVAKWFMGFQSFKFLFSFFLAPGILVGLYWFLRKKYFYQKEALEGYAVAFFVIALMDVLNDVGILLGVML